MALLAPPAVVATASTFVAEPIRVTLVRIRPARTIWRLRIPEALAEVCYGTVTGFDFAPTVDGADTGATVDGTDQGATVDGSDTSATVSGSDGGATVSGADTQREGC